MHKGRNYAFRDGGWCEESKVNGRWHKIPTSDEVLKDLKALQDEGVTKEFQVFSRIVGRDWWSTRGIRLQNLTGCPVYCTVHDQALLSTTKTDTKKLEARIKASLDKTMSSGDIDMFLADVRKDVAEIVDSHGCNLTQIAFSPNMWEKLNFSAKQAHIFFALSKADAAEALHPT